MTRTGYLKNGKVIVVAWDIGTDGYWEEFDGEFYSGEQRLGKPYHGPCWEPPVDLAAELEAWAAWADADGMPGDELTIKNWPELKAFSAKGLELAQWVKGLVGDEYKVVYWDDYAICHGGPGSKAMRLIRGPSRR